MHAVEKLLAEKAGRKEVRPGEIVNCDVDLAGINAGSGSLIRIRS